jgi:hypothetical protein
MQSIFNLKTSTDELESSNYGVSKDLYEQQAPTRDVTFANFPNGSINFRWQTGATKWWVPSRTYLRFRMSITQIIGANTGLAIDVNSADICPIMNQCAALFQSAEFRINDKTVSRISDYLPQIDTLNTRLNKSKAWIDSVGTSTNWWQENFQIRQENVSYNGEIDSTDTLGEESRAELGYTTANTLELVGATGVVTFALGGSTTPLPSIANTWRIGDILSVFVTGVGTIELRVVGTQPGGVAQTLLVQGWTQNIPAVNHDFKRLTSRGKENLARKVTDYEIIWTPPLSIFKVEHAIPACRCELILNPQTSSVYKKAVCESSVSDKTPGTDYDFSIRDMYLYVNTLEGARVDNLTYYLDLEQISCQAESLVGAVNFGQKNFDVSPSTKALAVAFQDSRVGTNTLFSSTKFRSYNALPEADETLKLNRMFVNYAGVSKPQIDADPEYVDYLTGAPGTATNGRDFTTQRYIETILNSGSYHDTGGSETLQEWQNRGAYYLFNWSKDGNDRSTRVAVHTGFASGTILNNARLLLFAISSQVAKIVIQNGAVTDVSLEDV